MSACAAGGAHYVVGAHYAVNCGRRLGDRSSSTLGPEPVVEIRDRFGLGPGPSFERKWFCVSDLHDWLWSLAAAAAVPVVSGRSLLHNGLLLRNEPPLLRRQTRRINCKDNCVSCGRQATRGNCHCGCQAVKGREPRSHLFYSIFSMYSS